MEKNSTILNNLIIESDQIMINCLKKVALVARDYLLMQFDANSANGSSNDPELTGWTAKKDNSNATLVKTGNLRNQIVAIDKNAIFSKTGLTLVLNASNDGFDYGEYHNDIMKRPFFEISSMLQDKIVMVYESQFDKFDANTKNNNFTSRLRR